MATPKDINVDPEKLKQLVKDITYDKNIILDPHGRNQRVYKRDPRYRQERMREEMPYTARGPLSHTTVNHCRLGEAGGMSGCYACMTYSDDKSKIQCQRACNFFVKSDNAERCMWETYGEFCWSTKAQDNKKAKGF